MSSLRLFFPKPTFQGVHNPSKVPNLAGVHQQHFSLLHLCSKKHGFSSLKQVARLKMTEIEYVYSNITYMRKQKLLKHYIPRPSVSSTPKQPPMTPIIHLHILPDLSVGYFTKIQIRFVQIKIQLRCLALQCHFIPEISSWAAELCELATWFIPWKCFWETSWCNICTQLHYRKHRCSFLKGLKHNSFSPTLWETQNTSPI